MSTGDKWDFVESSDKLHKLHKWRVVHTDGGIRTSGPFVTLADAKADAIKQGFNPDTDRWTVSGGGRTTYFRPGRISVNQQSDENPPD